MKQRVVIQTSTGSQGKAKNWPYFADLIALNPEVEFIEILIPGQVPVEGATPFTGTRREIINLLNECSLFISIDSWLQHLAKWNTDADGVVIFSRSNPALFGYKEFENVFKSNKYFKASPYEAWGPMDILADAFPTVEQVQNSFVKLLHKSKEKTSLVNSNA